MPTIENTVVGSLKPNNLPDRACVSTLQEFLDLFPQYFTVEVPASISNVVIGSSTPGSDDRNKLWLRRDNSGGITGLYAFQNGKWSKVNTAPDGAVELISGDSENPPPGYVAIVPGSEQLPAVQVNHLVSLSLPKGAGIGYQLYYAVFVGF